MELNHHTMSSLLDRPTVCLQEEVNLVKVMQLSANQAIINFDPERESCVHAEQLLYLYIEWIINLFPNIQGLQNN